MRIVVGLLFILSSEQVLKSGSTKEHVHFKIYVPEIINHQVHTKTVFIHIHKPDEPKKSKPKEEAPKTYHKEAHHEHWSSWSNHGYHSDYDDKAGDDHNHLSNNPKDHKNNEVERIEDVRKKIEPVHQYHKDSYLPALQQNDKPNYLQGQHGDMMGYSRPPQYEVQEDVKELDHTSIEPYMHMYEEGYHKGGESASGHTYSGDVTKFYDDKHEEGDHSVEDYQNESKEKTHAGRYFVDDSEYQQNSDKHEAESRVRPRRMFMPLSNGRWIYKNYLR